MSDDYKKVYLRLINTSTLATNGISPDEKIQKMTECIQLLAITQGMYLANIDKKIQQAIDVSNKKQCESCKAMKHANDIEKEQREKELIENYITTSGIKIDNNVKDTVDMSWQTVIKEILLKPYVYVVFCLITISPYGVDILKTLLNFFNAN